MNRPPVRLIRLLLLLTLASCEAPPVRYEETTSWARTDGDEEALAYARVAASTFVMKELEGPRTKLSVRLYVENLTSQELALNREAVRLLDGAEESLPRERLEPANGSDGLAIPPGDTRRFEVIFTLPQTSRPSSGSVPDFVLIWGVDQIDRFTTARALLFEDWFDHTGDGC
jgi:hypothetical protein